jgi:large subunit ribosomal protein L9
MLVILQKEVQNLGDAGSVVKVRAGYGRNFLIPNGFAIPANEGSVRVLEHQKRMAEAIRRKQLAAAQALADQVGKISLTFRREVGDEGKLFGSVTTKDIAEALAAEGVTIDRRSIQLDDAIRALGVVEVAIRLHKDVSAKIRVFVAEAR